MRGRQSEVLSWGSTSFDVLSCVLLLSLFSSVTLFFGSFFTISLLQGWANDTSSTSAAPVLGSKDSIPGLSSVLACSFWCCKSRSLRLSLRQSTRWFWDIFSPQPSLHVSEWYPLGQVWTRIHKEWLGREEGDSCPSSWRLPSEGQWFDCVLYGWMDGFIWRKGEHRQDKSSQVNMLSCMCTI